MVEIEIIPESLQLLKMDDSVYFSKKYKDYISNSKLSLANPDEGGSLEKYLSGFKQAYSESFELGTAVHNEMLQPDYYTISNIFKPSGKLGVFAEEVFKYRNSGGKIKDAIDKASISADYYAKNFTETRRKSAIKGCLPFYIERYKQGSSDSITYLSKQVYDKYLSCIDSLKRNYVETLLSPCTVITPPEVFNEYAILAEIIVRIDGIETILKIKGKLDNFYIDHDSNLLILNDLKTTGKPVNFFMGNFVDIIDEEGKKKTKWFDGSFQTYRYYRQLAMYNWLMQCVVQKEYGLCYKSKCNIIVVETIPNFSTKVCHISNRYIKKGLSEMKNLFILLAKWKQEGLIN